MESAQKEQRCGPLANVKVLDLSSYASGPNGCATLAELGAEVIKIEPPDGDAIRRYPSSIPTESRSFLGWNRGKKGIVIDLKNAQGKDVLRKLVQSSDVLLENFRPGVMERLGLSYSNLKLENPRLIYCAIRGFGDDGPLRDNPGYDTVLQTMTGMALFQGQSTDSIPQITAGSILDYHAGCLAALGVTSALYHRSMTGEGQYVSTSLLAAAIAIQSARFVWADSEPRDVSRDTKAGRVMGIYPTKDGYLFVSAHTTKFWTQLCTSLELDHLANDPRYDTLKKRAMAADELVPLISHALMKRSALEWEAAMKGEVPCAAVRSIEDLFEHPQVICSDLVRHLPHSGIGGYRTNGPALKFSTTSTPVLMGAPLLGEHTDIVLSAHGWTKAQIEELRDTGAIQ